jgi:hypothetical protein
MPGAGVLNESVKVFSGKHAFSVGLHAFVAMIFPRIVFFGQTNDCTLEVRRITTQLGESG